MVMEWEQYGLKVSVGENWDDELGYRSEKWLGGNLCSQKGEGQDEKEHSVVHV